MSLYEYRYDGSRAVAVKELPTGAGEKKKDKKALVRQTEKNLEQAALL